MAWPLVELDAICTKITDGSHNPPKGIDRSEYIMLSSKNVFDDHIHFEKPRYLAEADFEQENKRTDVSPGDILLTIVGTIGRVAVYPKNGPRITLQRSVAVLKPEKGLVSPRYMMFALQNSLDALLGHSRGVAQKGLYLKTLRKQKIPLPTLDEQERIVAILDQAFEGIDKAIANTEQNLKNARELFESFVNSAFSQTESDWTNCQLGNICDFQNGFAFKSSDAVDRSNVQLVRMGNLYKNVLDLERKPSFYPDSFSAGYERYELREGDLIISLTGTVGKEDYGYVVKVPFSEKTLLLNQRIAKVVNIQDAVEKDYLQYVLRSRAFLDQLFASASGTRQANLSTAKMKKLTICFPPKEEQSRILICLRELEKHVADLVEMCKKKLLLLDDLKQSLLQKAFSGELTGATVQEAMRVA